MDEPSLRTLEDANAGRFKDKGDSLVVFTYWFLRKYTFDLMQDDKIDSEFDINRRGPDGGFGLMFSINGHKMEVRILRSDIYMTIYFTPQDGNPQVDFKLKIEAHIKHEQHEKINDIKKTEKIFTEKLFSIQGRISMELQKTLIASSSDAGACGASSRDADARVVSSSDAGARDTSSRDVYTGSSSIDDVLESGKGILSPSTQDSITGYVAKTP